jgi:threonine/homoserine/homoserine lactone efflux protein
MISVPLLLLFLLAAGALIVIPGPAVLFIVARSIHQGWRAGVISALGVACGGLVHITGAVLGFSALLASSAVAFATVRWAGAAYLVYLGVKTWLTRDDEPAAVPAPVPPRRLFAQGFVVNLTNPKTALFFFAFLPQFVDPSLGHAPLQMLMLGAIFTLMSVTSDSTYGVLASALKDRLARNVTARRNVRWISGGVYVALGLGTALVGARASNA